jgi:hypothetical protein
MVGWCSTLSALLPKQAEMRDWPGIAHAPVPLPQSTERRIREGGGGKIGYMPEWFFALDTVLMLTIVVTATIVSVARIFRVLFIDLFFHDLRFGLNVKPPLKIPWLADDPSNFNGHS